MSNRLASLLVVTIGLIAGGPALSQDNGKGVTLKFGKVQESATSAKLPDPHYAYVGQLGSFVVIKNDMAKGMIVVHQYPDTSKSALGCTKLTFEGAKRLGEIEGWVFKTEWDGKVYPSRIFFSAEKVYFGGGVNGYIAADYRDDSGWVWKLQPLRRMGLVKNNGAAAE
jgi:hypothetical protein